MGIFKNTLAMVGAVALASTPVIAQAAAKQPVAERVSEKTAEESSLESGAGWFLLPAALIAIIVGIVIAVQQEGDSPSSPG